MYKNKIGLEFRAVAATLPIIGFAMDAINQIK
jgi:hypothetical protein